MCESNAYLMRDGEESLIMESVDSLKQEGDQVTLKSIFGEQATLQATVKEMNLTGHRIVLTVG